MLTAPWSGQFRRGSSGCRSLNGGLPGAHLIDSPPMAPAARPPWCVEQSKKTPNLLHALFDRTLLIVPAGRNFSPEVPYRIF